MSLNRNEWYEIAQEESGTTFARWRDATADQRSDVFAFEKLKDNEVVFYEEYADENLAISRLELAITGGS
jgi:hypothetical protein